MSLPCQKKCDGKVKAPFGKGRRSGWWYEGDEVVCPKCGAQYVVKFTDDFKDDAVPYLQEAKP